MGAWTEARNLVVVFGERTGGSASLIEPKVEQVIASYFALRNALKDALDKKLHDEKKLNQ